jgi:hypothetical protein
MSNLLAHLERQRRQQQQQQQQQKASKQAETATPRAPEDAVFVKDDLQSVVDLWMKASATTSRAPQHAVDIFANAVDPRAGLGASFVSKRRIVSDTEASKAMEASVSRVKRRAAREEDDALADQRFDALVHKEKRPRVVVQSGAASVGDDDDSERGRSDTFGKSRKGAPPTTAVHHKLLDKKKRKKKNKQNQNDSGANK